MPTVFAATRSVVTALAVLLLPVPALAQSNPDIARQLADTSFQSGLRLFKKGDYERAVIEFTKANAVYPRGATTRNIALCELKLGKPLDALKHLRAAIATPDLKPELREAAKEELADTYAQTGHVAVHSSSAGATLLVDGQGVGTAPKDEPVDVMPGHHVIEARAGERTARAEVDAPKGTVVTAEVTIAEPAPPAPPIPVALPATEPVSPTNPAAGPSDAIAPSFWTTRRKVGVVVGGVGVAAVVVGEVFRGEMLHAENSVKSLSQGQSTSSCSSNTTGACASIAHSLNSQQQDATAAAAFWIAGGAAILTGAVLVVWPDHATSSSASIQPMAGPGGGGLLVRGEF